MVESKAAGEVCRDVVNVTHSGGMAAADPQGSINAAAGKKPPRPPKGAVPPAKDGAAQIFMYVGPTLPGGILRRNAVFRGTRELVKTHLSAAIEAYPQTEKLIVPVDKLAFTKKRIESGGNATEKAFSELAHTGFKNKED